MLNFNKSLPCFISLHIFPALSSLTMCVILTASGRDRVHFIPVFRGYSKQNSLHTCSYIYTLNRGYRVKKRAVERDLVVHRRLTVYVQRGAIFYLQIYNKQNPLKFRILSEMFGTLMLNNLKFIKQMIVGFFYLSKNECGVFTFPEA